MRIKQSGKSSPLVSVIMPTYNSAKFISESLESVISQSYGFENIEICLVDDKSTDDTAAVIAPYIEQYSNIHYVQLEKNSGAAIARNKAIEISQGKYLAFLDSDDIWESQKLEKQIGFMLEYDIAFSATGYVQIDESGESLHKALIPPKKTNYNKMLRLSCPVGNLTCVYDVERIGKIYAPNIRKRNDFALWLAVLKKADYCFGMEDILAKYRIRNGSISHNKLALIKFHWQLYHDIEMLSSIKCVWLMLCWAWTKGTGFGITKKSLLH